MTVLDRPAAPARGRLPVAARDRRPALAALAVLLVLGGALTSALIAFRSGDRVQVLVTAHAVQPGQVITGADLRTAQAAVDGAQYVPAAAVRNFTGTVAAVGIPAGTIVTRQMFLAGEVVPAGADVVGVVLSASHRPADALATGDVVRVFLTPRADATGATAASTVLVSAALVTAVDDGHDGTAISVLVPGKTAPAVVAAAATDQVAVSRLAGDTPPVVDYEKG